jgi:hypothetical protein
MGNIENGMLIGAQAQIDAQAAADERHDQAVDAAWNALREEFIRACEAGNWQAPISALIQVLGQAKPRSEPLDGLMLLDERTTADLLNLVTVALASNDAGLRIVAMAVIVGAATRHAHLHQDAAAELLLEGGAL